MSCENVILVSMQDYMDRITLIALMTGTVLVEIAIDGQPPLDHLPKEKIHAKTFVGYKTIKSAWVSKSKSTPEDYMAFQDPISPRM
jgi:hypothetical protein